MKNKITQAEVNHLADLSRLDLSTDEKAKMAQDIDGILNLVDELQELDLKNEKPFLFEDQVNIVREDGPSHHPSCLHQAEIKDEPRQEEFLKAAPDRDSKFFKVPRIL